MASATARGGAGSPQHGPLLRVPRDLCFGERVAARLGVQDEHRHQERALRLAADDSAQHPTTAEYAQIFGDPTFQKALINSTIIASVTTVICLVFGSITAYAIARLRFRFKSTVMTLILAISFFPAVAIIAPLFMQFTAVGLINTYWSVIITDTVFALPLTIWLLVAFFRELPRDLEDAQGGRGDDDTGLPEGYRAACGAGGVYDGDPYLYLRLERVPLRQHVPLRPESTQPVTVVIPNFATIYTVDYGAQAAAAVVVTVPLVIMVLIFQRRIVSGLTAGAVKG